MEKPRWQAFRDTRKSESLQTLCERSDTGKVLEVGVEDIAPQDEIGGAAVALDADEPGILELLHVMGEGGGADVLHLLHACAWGGALVAAEGDEDFVATWLGEGAGDERALLVGELEGLLRQVFHGNRVNCARCGRHAMPCSLRVLCATNGERDAALEPAAAAAPVSPRTRSIRVRLWSRGRWSG